MSNKGEIFLDKIYQNLYMSDEVRHTYKNGDKRYESIRRYLERLDRIHKKADTETKKELLKKCYYNRYIIKADGLRENIIKLIDQNKDYFLLVDKYESLLEENNFNGILETMQNIQKESLSKWIDYLSDSTTNYPLWAKYWVFQGMLKMGTYDEGLGIYQKRTKNTEAPFVDCNPELIAKSIELIKKHINKEKIEDKELDSIVKTCSFQKIYTYLEKEYIKNIEHYGTEGIWIKYNKNNMEDAKRLYDSLQYKNTHWCTAASEEAKNQLKQGDFFVYYSKDKEGNYTLPRIAIRMLDSYYIEEIRGIDECQNLEEEMIPILEEKLNDNYFRNVFDSGYAIKELIKIIEDLRKLTEIYKKTVNKEELTSKELEFLYLTGKTSFGHGPDPREKRVIEMRNFEEDLKAINDIDKQYTIIKNCSILNFEVSKINDRNIIENLIEIDGMCISVASDELRNDKELSLKAIKSNAFAFKYAPKEIKNDKKVLMEVIEKVPDTFMYASDELQNDKEVALCVAKKDIFYLSNCSDELKKDPDIIKLVDEFPFQNEEIKKMILSIDSEIMKID